MKRKSTWLLGALAALWLVSAGPAGAQVYHDLTIEGWMVGYKTVYTNMGNFHAGAFTWSWDSGPVNNASAMYCLDVNNSFSGIPSTWEVSRHLVPPDPQFPPPHNTDHAAWLYYTYGRLSQLSAYADKASRAASVQLALWEVSHDLNWFTLDNTWLSSGDFKWTGTFSSQIRVQATDMLHSLYDALDGDGRVVPPSSAYWYQPKGWPDPQTGQGQLGEVPEPGTLVLLGAGLLAAGGLAWRRRSRQA